MDYETARACWVYEPDTGLLRHASGPKCGAVAGGANGVSQTYRTVKHGGKSFKAHRIAWLLAHGSMPRYEIDHINGIKSDNRLENLRDVPHRENQLNQKHHRTGCKKADWRRDRVRDANVGMRDEKSQIRDAASVTPRARALLRRDVTVSRRDDWRDNRRDSDSPAPGRSITVTATDVRFAAWLAAATPAQVEAWKRRNGGRIELAEPTDDQLPEPLRGGALVVF